MLFDLPHVIERAPDVLRAAGVTDRCDLAAGSFFEGVPGGHDAYLLKWIIHDWDDARSIAILRACHGAMSGRGTLLVVERVLGDCTTSGRRVRAAEPAPVGLRHLRELVGHLEPLRPRPRALRHPLAEAHGREVTRSRSTSALASGPRGGGEPRDRVATLLALRYALSMA
jgi:hypothetical protein